MTSSEQETTTHGGVCQHVDCNSTENLGKRMVIMGETVLEYCPTHDPLSEDTKPDPDLWKEVDS